LKARLRRLKSLSKNNRRVIDDKELLKLLIDFLDTINDRLDQLDKKLDNINTSIGLIVEIKDRVKDLERYYE
jgi:ABC-type transporter Mla subunit MlaD